MARNTSKWQAATVIFVLLILVVLVGLLLWGIEKIWFLFWDYISHSQPTIGAAVIATCGTVLISVLSVVLARFFERNKELTIRRRVIEQEIREKHLPTYQELVQFLLNMLKASKAGKQLSEKEINDFFTDFTQKALVWGSDRFIRDFSAFRDAFVLYEQQQTNGNATSEDMTTAMLTLENLLYSIRADCGHENKGLGKGDLLTFFINDIRNYVPKEQIVINSKSH